MKSFLLILSTAVITAMLIVPGSARSAPASTKATADTLRQLEGEFMKATAERGSQGYLSYYADDAVEIPNGAQ